MAAGASGLAYVFDALGGALKRKLGNRGTPLVAAEISPQGDKVLTADASGHISVWSLTDARALVSVNGAAGAPVVNEIHFSPDGATIIAACADDKVRTWNAQTGLPELTMAEETVPGEIGQSRRASTPRFGQRHADSGGHAPRALFARWIVHRRYQCKCPHSRLGCQIRQTVVAL